MLLSVSKGAGCGHDRRVFLHPSQSQEVRPNPGPAFSIARFPVLCLYGLEGHAAAPWEQNNFAPLWMQQLHFLEGTCIFCSGSYIGVDVQEAEQDLGCSLKNDVWPTGLYVYVQKLKIPLHFWRTQHHPNGLDKVLCKPTTFLVLSTIFLPVTPVHYKYLALYIRTTWRQSQ